MKSILYLYGAGNPEGVRLALRINEKKKLWKNIFILDDDPSKSGKKILGVEISGPINILGNADPADAEVVNLVARTTSKRKAAYEKIYKYGIPLVSLIDTAVDIMGVDYKGDILIYPNVTFSAGAFLDQGSIVFTGAVIGHGCSVGQYCTIAPGAVLNARVILEEGAYIGTNASVLPDLKIGAWATVGLNSGVVQNVPAGATAMGVPAELIMIPASYSMTAENTESTTNTEKQNPDCKEEPEDLENEILTIWKEMLNVNAIKPKDNFFDLGGNSLLAVQLFGKLKNELKLKINLIDIFHYPTIKSFIDFIDKHSSADSELSLSADSKRVVLFRQRYAKYSSKKSNDPDDNKI